MREIRVHGVGGPQEARLLGVVSERDLEVVAVGNGTRFMRRRGTDDGVEGYSWGGLTSSSLNTTSWILYLPFTLINAAGWAAPQRLQRTENAAAVAGGPGAVSPTRKSPFFWIHGALCKVLGLAATVGIVFWLGLVLVDLVGWQWRRRLLQLKLAVENAWLSGLIEYVMPVLCATLFAALVAALFLVLRARAPVPDDPRDNAKWWGRESFEDKTFYYHARQLGLWRAVHIAMAALAVASVLGLAVLRHEHQNLRLGDLVVGAALLQSACVAGLWVLAAWRRARPISAMAATYGAVLANAFLAGIALLVVKHLSKFPKLPKGAATAEVVGGPELGFTSAWLWSLLLGLVVLAVAVVHLYVKPIQLDDLPDTKKVDPTGPPDLTPSMRAKVATARRLARLAHSALTPGYLLAGSMVVGAAVFAAVLVSQDRWPWDRSLGYRPGAWPEWAGGLLLAALPVLVAVGLRKAALSPEKRRTLGIMWDVVVIWPARYHPLAIPPYAAEATDELAARIGCHLDKGRVLVSAHSQGTALAFIALRRLAAERSAADMKRVTFLTYGSHLNGLYALAFPRHFNRTEFLELQGVLADWHSFWRRTDPIGGPVFALVPYRGEPVPGEESALDEVCPDPAQERPADLPPVAPPLIAPLERDREPWIDLAVHSWYLAEPALKAWVQTAKAADGTNVVDGEDQGARGFV